MIRRKKNSKFPELCFKCSKKIIYDTANNPTLPLIKQKVNFFQSARGAIRQIAQQNYNNSNKPKECFICGYSTYIEIAHIKSISSFPETSLIKEIKHIDNLVALCPTHHWEFDNNIFSLMQNLC